MRGAGIEPVRSHPRLVPGKPHGARRGLREPAGRRAAHRPAPGLVVETSRRLHRRGCHPRLQRGVDHPRSSSNLGITGFPFDLAHRILTGEPFKSLASFAGTLPTLAERSQRSPGDQP
jgi:hypothetical protein